MATPQGLVLVVFGLFVCFTGYSMFKSMMPLWGFILGGLVAISFMPAFMGRISTNPMVVQIVTFVVGGVLGALISAPLYYVSVFLTGASMGGLMGIILGSYLQFSGGTISAKALLMLSNTAFPPPVTSSLQVILMVVFGLATGAFAISFQKFMISASTAMVGSAALVAGVNSTSLDILRSNPSRGIWVLIFWFILSMVGLYVQYRMRDET